MLKLMPYKRHSKSGRTLRYAFVPRIKVVHPDLSPKGSDVVINWGCTKTKPTARCRFLNRPESVQNAVNKLKAFTVLKTGGVKIPEFTTSFEKAKEWVDDGKKVLARKLLESHSGNGIVLVKEGTPLPTNFPLYVKYFKKEHEYRVHVFNGQVIDYVEKKKREGISETQFNKYIRSYNNGWVFCRDGVALPEVVKLEAIKAVSVLGLDFGAVDIAMNGNKVAVFEVNTAPALEGTTVEKYKTAFAQYVR